jgi:hypothetical protein
MIMKRFAAAALLSLVASNSSLAQNGDNTDRIVKAINENTAVLKEILEAIKITERTPLHITFGSLGPACGTADECLKQLSPSCHDVGYQNAKVHMRQNIMFAVTCFD